MGRSQQTFSKTEKEKKRLKKREDKKKKMEARKAEKEESDEDKFDPVRVGTVNFFDHSKGFGFIVDNENNEKYFCHVSGLIDEITEGNKVSFELEKGQRGMNAVKVKLEK